MSRRNSTEIVHEGWLTKSPPIKRIWRARWRRRWFVLRQTGELPGQYFLEYYTDRQCLKLKGSVDLDQLEQVDAGLQFENSKLKYLKHLFDLKTPKRTYYLAADSEADMNKWVDCVCQVCGLKADNHEDEYDDFEPPLEETPPQQNHVKIIPVEKPTASPPSTPYILMSECYSGRLPPAVALAQRRAERPIRLQDKLSNVQQDDFYDAPRRLEPPAALDLVPPPSGNTPPLQSPGLDSVFSEDEWPVLRDSSAAPGVNWSTFPRDSSVSSADNDVPSGSSDIGSWSVARRFSKINIKEVGKTDLSPPPRPPKPSHLLEASHSYLNLSLQPGDPGSNSHLAEPPSLDTMYDFPRSHTVPQATVSVGNVYTNAAPGSGGGPGQGVVFRYDFPNVGAPDETAGDIEPSTPKSESGSVGSATTATVYSNLPSPAPPPCVNRELKPGRRCSESLSNEPSPLPPCSPAGAPSVDRKLKPRKLPESPKLDPGAIPLQPAPTLRDAASLINRRKPRAAPSPTPGVAPPSPAGFSLQHSEAGCWSSDEETRFRDSADEEANFHHIKDTVGGRIQFDKMRLDKVKYLDLDHDTMLASTKSPKTKSKPNPERATIYNTVDFVKTKALNRTRQEVELKRQSPSSTATVPS